MEQVELVLLKLNSSPAAHSGVCMGKVKWNVRGRKEEAYLGKLSTASQAVAFVCQKMLQEPGATGLSVERRVSRS